jgi:hypothetical protein
MYQKLQTQIIAQKIAEFRRRLPTVDSGLICISELAIICQSMVIILMREKRERGCCSNTIFRNI